MLFYTFRMFSVFDSLRKLINVEFDRCNAEIRVMCVTVTTS
jgi:hypothetical protein